jgi:hypothetical protein
MGQFSLADLPKLLVKSALFVGNNSGPQHLAAGLGIPTLGIHSGVVDAHEWGPLGPNAVAVRRDMSCSPCFIEQPKDCPRSLACLTELDVISVFNSCMQLLIQPTRLRPSGPSGPSSPRLGAKPAIASTGNEANCKSNALSAESKSASVRISQD